MRDDAITGHDGDTDTRINKLTSVVHASVLLLIMNFVITLSK